MAALIMRNCLAKARRSKLSTGVGVLFVGALIIPWCAYAWLAATERAEQVKKTEQYLTSLATGYAEHATTLMRLGITVPTDEAVANPGVARAKSQGEEEIDAFRSALNAAGVKFSLRRIGEASGGLSGVRGPDAAPDLTPKFDVANGIITAEVDRPAAAIAATASMGKDQALKEWQTRANTGAIALLLRSLFVAGVGWFVVLQLRRREAMETELRVAKKAAEAASQTKSEFLAHMSHELRTPLNAIIGFSEIIKNQKFGPASERYPVYAGDIFNSGTHLLALINDILNLSKLEAGRFVLQEDNVDLSVTVEACLNVLETQAQLSKIELSVSLDSGMRWIRADERRLRQILINLLSNAVKFTPEGGQVRVSSVPKQGGLAIAVSDTGAGMAPEDIPNAMTPFGQIDSKVRRKLEGTGLGLPLAKQLVELHGGTFSIESKVGVGTTVRFVLPPGRIIATPAPGG
jgi:signal transduction histidine kinase